MNYNNFIQIIVSKKIYDASCKINYKKNTIFINVLCKDDLLIFNKIKGKKLIIWNNNNEIKENISFIKQVPHIYNLDNRTEKKEIYNLLKNIGFNIKYEKIVRNLLFDKINQIHISQNLHYLSEIILKKYTATLYYDNKKPCIFFGIYNSQDIDLLNKHKGRKVIMWHGNDIEKNINFLNNKYEHISTSFDTELLLSKHDINFNKYNLNLIDENILKPITLVGDKIFIDNGISHEYENIYGAEIYKKIITDMPNYEYILKTDINNSNNNLYNVYSQCFIALRLTNEHDDTPEIINIFESMNIPVVHNFSKYGLKWKTIDDVKKYINTKYEKNCVNFEYDYDYDFMLQNSNKGNISNELNLVQRYITEGKYNIFINKKLIHQVTNIGRYKYSIVRGIDAMKRDDIPQPKYSFMVPYDKHCDGIYYLTKSWIEEVKNKNSILYGSVYDPAIFNEINNKDILLLEQKIDIKNYNWYDDDEIIKLKEKYFDRNDFVICVSGRIGINSYPTSLIYAIKLLREKYSNVYLLVMGEIVVSPYRLTKKLFNEIKKLEWVKNIIVDKKDVLNYYRICDVLTSTYRDYCNNICGCNKIKEYLLCDKPIICSRGKERENELGKNYDGFYDCDTCNTVPPLNLTMEFMNNPEIYQKQYDKYFSNINMNKEIIQIYNKLNKIIEKKKMILYIYDKSIHHISTVYEYDMCLYQYSKYNIVYYDINEIKNTIPKNDIIILSYSIMHSLATSDVKEWNICRKILTKYFEDYNGKKLCFIQDEYYHVDAINTFLKKYEFDVIFTCLNNPDDIKKIYGNIQAKFVNVLTGYVSKNDCKHRKRISEKKCRIFYRGRKLNYIYGELGYMKLNIGIKMKEYAQYYNVDENIEWTNNNRIYLDQWINTLSMAKTTLATPSGSNVINKDDKLLRDICKTYNIPISHLLPDDFYVPFSEVKNKFNIYEDLNVGQISPKMFEAISVGTVLIMFRDKYSGILEADKHYIPLEKDFSNIEYVFSCIKNDQYLQKIADNAYKDIVESELYSYKTFVKKLDNIFDDLYK